MKIILDLQTHKQTDEQFNLTNAFTNKILIKFVINILFLFIEEQKAKIYQIILVTYIQYTKQI